MKDSLSVYHFSFTIVVHTGETQSDTNISVWTGPAESQELPQSATIERVSFQLGFLGRGGTRKIYGVDNDSTFGKDVFTATVDTDWITTSREKSISEVVSGEHLIEAYIKGYLTAIHGEIAREAFGFAV